MTSSQVQQQPSEKRSRWSRLALPLVLTLVVGAGIGFIIGALVLTERRNRLLPPRAPFSTPTFNGSSLSLTSSSARTSA